VGRGNSIATLSKCHARASLIGPSPYAGRIGGALYTDGEVDRLAAIDPLFEPNNRSYRNKGRACAAGETTISVRGDGGARRCHFVDAPIGNIYNPDFELSLRHAPVRSAPAIVISGTAICGI
jgi:MoaA/NifB/PqqE/SkfB family radical SAM enzyme